MLFVLTGNVQTGKTRWLERLVDSLEDAGVEVFGVLAPGAWADRRDEPEPGEHVDANGFEKLGIDNVLLPSRERLVFARRADLAVDANEYDPEAQSARAKLTWHISDAAIARVNAHFKKVAPSLSAKGSKGLLIVDELGQLELKRNGGLTEAVALLEAGPFPAAGHALIVVRETLLPLIEGHFGGWGEHVRIAPTGESRALILESLS